MLARMSIPDIDLSQTEVDQGDQSAVTRLLLKVSARQAGTLLERKDHQEISAILATRYGYVRPQLSISEAQMTQLHDTDRDFLQDLGRRVCTARTLRRWSRRTLAVMSGISERYIAQLEAGKGNISILLLCRISRAMTVPLTDILPSGASMEQDRHAPFHPGQ